jgi:glycosyltransferase involved in cell wall biosynthesis
MVMRKLLLADIVQFEYPYLLPFMLLLRVIGKPLVLDEHGVESVFIRELKKIPLDASLRSNSIGFVLRKIPGLVPVVLWIEKIAVTIASLVFACSESDALQLRRLYKLETDHVVVVPNCADSAFFVNVVPNQFNRPTVLFMGSFNHPPNVHAASLLLEQIIPCVRQSVKEVLLVMVGRNPPSRLVHKEREGVVFTGEVKDPRPFITGADVAVAPIFFGSGTRQKIIDYMALGKPIVSTTKGAEGLDLRNEMHFLRRDTVKGFCDATIELLTHRDKAALLGYRARKVARDKYSWDGQVVNIVRAYAKILGEHRNKSAQRS